MDNQSRGKGSSTKPHNGKARSRNNPSNMASKATAKASAVNKKKPKGKPPVPKTGGEGSENKPSKRSARSKQARLRRQQKYRANVKERLRRLANLERHAEKTDPAPVGPELVYPAAKTLETSPLQAIYRPASAAPTVAKIFQEVVDVEFPVRPIASGLATAMSVAYQLISENRSMFAIGCDPGWDCHHWFGNNGLRELRSKAWRGHRGAPNFSSCRCSNLRTCEHLAAMADPVVLLGPGARADDLFLIPPTVPVEAIVVGMGAYTRFAGRAKRRFLILGKESVECPDPPWWGDANRFSVGSMLKKTAWKAEKICLGDAVMHVFLSRARPSVPTGDVLDALEPTRFVVGGVPHVGIGANIVDETVLDEGLLACFGRPDSSDTDRLAARTMVRHSREVQHVTNKAEAVFTAINLRRRVSLLLEIRWFAYDRVTSTVEWLWRHRTPIITAAAVGALGLVTLKRKPLVPGNVLGALADTDVKIMRRIGELWSDTLVLTHRILVSSWHKVADAYVGSEIADKLASLGRVAFEELLKRAPYGAGLFPILSIECSKHGLNNYWPTAAMHVATWTMPYLPGVGVHWLFNQQAAVPGSVMDTYWGVQIFRFGFASCMPLAGACVNDAYRIAKIKARCVTTVETKEEKVCMPSPVVWPVGFALADLRPLVFSSCPHNEWNAVATRIGQCKATWDADPGSDYKAWKAVFTFAHKQAWELARASIQENLTEPDFEVWNSKYPLAQRERNLRALSDVQAGVIFEGDWTTRSFIKIERLPYDITEPERKPKNPRIIQGRSDRVKVIAGAWFNMVSKAVAAAWNTSSQIYYPSGSSSEELGHWARVQESAGLVPICCDFSRWDSTVGPGALFEWSKFNRRLGCPDMVWKFLMRRHRPQKGITKFGISYSRLGQVSSGDPDTSIGNSYIHGLGWLYVLHKVCKMPSECRVVILGDDAVIAVSPIDVQNVLKFAPAIWRKLGPNLTVESYGDWDTAEFCSGYFWRVKPGVSAKPWNAEADFRGYTRVYGPKPARVLGKTFWTTVPFSKRKQKMWLRGLCLGLAHNASHVPLLDTAIRRQLHLLGEGKTIVRRETYEKVKCENEHGPPCDEAWVQLSVITGLSLDELQSMDEELEAASHLRADFSGSGWSTLCKHA